MKKLIITLLIAAFFTVTAFAGVEWTSTITTHGTSKHTNNEIISHVYAEKGNLKQVFEGVSNENMFHFQNGYWLYKVKDDRIYIVDNNKKSYMVLDLDSLLQLTGMFGKLVKIKIADHTINTETLPKETIAGYSCNHIKITSQYSMTVKIAFIKKKMKVHEVKEIWSTADMPGLKELHQSFVKKDFNTGIADLDEMLQKEMEQQKKLGFPLKMITTNIQKNKKGKVKSEATTTMKVSNIKTKSFPASFFEIPGEYDRVQSPTEGKKLGIF